MVDIISKRDGPRKDDVAAKENGFFALIEDELKERPADFDSRETSYDFSEEDLTNALSERLDI